MVAVKLTDVDEVGVLSIQVVGPGLSQLEELTKQIEEKCSTKQTTKIAVGGMYCTEYSLDLCWYRVRVVKEMSSREVHVRTFVYTVMFHVYVRAMLVYCICMYMNVECPLLHCIIYTCTCTYMYMYCTWKYMCIAH